MFLDIIFLVISENKSTHLDLLYNFTEEHSIGEKIVILTNLQMRLIFSHFNYNVTTLGISLLVINSHISYPIHTTYPLKSFFLNPLVYKMKLHT